MWIHHTVIQPRGWLSSSDPHRLFGWCLGFFCRFLGTSSVPTSSGIPPIEVEKTHAWKGTECTGVEEPRAEERYPQLCQEKQVRASGRKVTTAWVIVFHGDRDRKGKHRSNCQS